MSPRRSSRARSTQNTLPSTSNLKRRPYVPNARGGSPRRRSPNLRSESIEDTDPASRTADSAVVSRRSRRGELENNHKKTSVSPEDEEDDIEEPLEEEITRCICGRAEYPGPGPSVKEQMPNGELLSDDVGNFFVQCDKCHVWQHGGCMGLTDESMLPDEYYCETCKPEYHRIIRGSNGIITSRYLPVLEGAVSEGSSPLSSDVDVNSHGISNKLSNESTRRRATMNSRTAYDEDEALRRAIEESKEMGGLKRSRDDSDEQRPSVKRQRTGSSVSSSGSHGSQSPQSTTEQGARNGANGHRSSKLRDTLVKNNKEKEIRDKQKEALASQRAEAASKRNARSERRRAEDSPPASPALSPSKSLTNMSKPNIVVKDATPPAKPPLNKKGGRPPARRGRLGRNQYTRDFPLNGDTSDSPLRDTSRDPHVDSPRPHTNGNGYKDGINGESGRSSKVKTHSARTSMNEMKRRVAAILEFVGRMQNERNSGTKTSSASGSGSSSLKGNSTPNGSNAATNLPTASLVKAISEGLEEADAHKSKAEHDGSEESAMKIVMVASKAFDAMNSVEMMDTLTTELVKWQNVWGTYGR